jgi:mycofactocin precursor
MMKREEKESKREKENQMHEEPDIIEEIEVEDLTVDGICGVY